MTMQVYMATMSNPMVTDPRAKSDVEEQHLQADVTVAIGQKRRSGEEALMERERSVMPVDYIMRN
jgi:hypothetical protein